MFPEFTFAPPDPSTGSREPEARSAEEEKEFNELMSRLLKPEEKDRLTRLLLQRLKEHKARLRQLFEEMCGHWTCEDHFYRYYHGSFKVYGVQVTTEKAVQCLRELLPERKLNLAFERIIHEGTGKTFEMSHNEEWDHQTRPMLEAFSHAKFMIEMAVGYGDLPEPPTLMPSGWAALLYLYDLR